MNEWEFNEKIGRPVRGEQESLNIRWINKVTD
jgi:hypothetical protein